MFEALKKYLQYQFHHPNYLFFMVSLILLILVPPLSTLFGLGTLLLNLTFGGVILMAVFYTTSSYREFTSHALLGLILFLVFLFNPREGTLMFLNPLLMFLFFLLVFRNIVYHLFHIEKIQLNEVYASVAGYLVLGIMVTPFFFLLEQNVEDAFNLPENAEFYDFLYFSYITLTSVGFGDISPVHHIAKSFTILVSIFGQLYLTILVAIIIGKYLAFEIKEDITENLK